MPTERLNLPLEIRCANAVDARWYIDHSMSIVWLRDRKGSVVWCINAIKIDFCFSHSHIYGSKRTAKSRSDYVRQRIDVLPESNSDELENENGFWLARMKCELSADSLMELDSMRQQLSAREL